MSDFELTESGIEALVSSIMTGVFLVIISSINQYGPLLAGILGLLLLIIGVFNLYQTWEDHQKVPILGIIFVSFGVVFEFGAATDIAAVLPLCVYVDAGIIVVSFLVAVASKIFERF